jgi:hypothetical protein
MREQKYFGMENGNHVLAMKMPRFSKKVMITKPAHYH